MSDFFTKKTPSLFETMYREREARARKKRREAPAEWIEAERVRPVVREWIARFERENDAAAVSPEQVGGWCGGEIATSVGSVGARDALAFRAGISLRSIWRWLEGRPNLRPRAGKPGRFYVENRERFLSVDTVDRLFVAMDCVYLFHRHPSTPGGSDGFADVYFHPSIVDAPLTAEEEETLAEVLDLAVARAQADGLLRSGVAA